MQQDCIGGLSIGEAAKKTVQSRSELINSHLEEVTGTRPLGLDSILDSSLVEF